MAMSREQRRAILIRPLAIWAALLLLGGVSLIYALVPDLPLKPVMALTIVAVQAALVLAGLMNIGKASPLVRTTAIVGTVWLGFLFLLTFADLLTR
jgi:chromate transport protein ChrA